jgi:hypothetical protein
MASLFLRLVHGNQATPVVDDSISIDVFVAALNAWQRGEITRAQVIAAFSFDAADEVDLDLIKSWYNASTDKPEFLRVLEGRLLMGQRKRTSSGALPNGFFDYAIKNTFLNGADGLTPLSNLPASAVQRVAKPDNVFKKVATWLAT